ncbi:hypothetical protein ACT17_23090 [Mycolicibacterium conceptionense]|uniref:Uncharacterized protein n=1 Tax=Mycolicibacterium conceptionense TaxID=451644 RepID=A0A0J8U357_9MYCO|nr:hypothetical protein [Mycolicibacterium conceptionense]KMV15978.1 hypothetical protein ACT17_23090 [Mycolicibacterium conceptionense]
MSTGLQPRRPDLRGKCQAAAKELAAQDPTLRVVRGWYIDIDWGEQEHWWCERPDGTVIDPTVEQFPTGHVEALRQYREYAGVHPCPGCGIPVEGETGFCCGGCHGATVGVPIGSCVCEFNHQLLDR